MKNTFKSPSILFLNQMAGPLFRELAEDIALKWPPCQLYTGHHDTLKARQMDSLQVIAAPTYNRTSHAKRLLSWLHYWVYAFFRCLFSKKGTIIFIVFPPFLGLITYFLKKIRKQRYIVLVYDIYPDTFINFGPLKETGIIARLWRRMNKLVWENAEVVFTIGYKMAENLESNFDSSKTTAGKVVVIPNWASTNWIQPVEKKENEFARKYDQVDKLTVMYSGNLGATHDIETILNTAKKLRNNESIHFMIIGEGAKKNLVEKFKSEENLGNLTVLSYQPEEVLPQSLTTADIAVITLDSGSEGLSVPSKTYYSMASGACLLGLCDSATEVARAIEKHECGILINPGDVGAMALAITNLLDDKESLKKYKDNSRSAAEKYYSRNNTSEYIEAISKTCNI
jgi:glycosyltransferase involved in cell wall biosynthesis